MNKETIVEHAQNMHPPPPIEISVEGGRILSFKITEQNIQSYTAEEITTLFKTAGLDIEGLLIPIPEEFGHVPLNALSYRLVPGEYSPVQINESLILPREAFQYFSSK